MKILLLAALFAAADLASANKNLGPTDTLRQGPWQVGKVYRYDVQLSNLVHLHERTTSGNVLRARFIIRVVAPGVLQAKLKNPEQAKIHQELSLKRDIPDDLHYEAVKNLDLPFEITIEDGEVQFIKMPASVSLQSENILKGLISALQVDLSSHHQNRRSHEKYDEETHQGVFKKRETDVTGNCDTLYTVSPVASEWRRELPNWASAEEPIEVTKSKDYGHCHRRVAYHFGVPKEAVWFGTASKIRQEQIVNPSTVSRMLMAKQGPIYKTEVTSTVHVHPYMYGKQQKAEVVSKVQMELISFEQDSETEWKIQEVRLIKSLLYSLTSKQLTDNSQSSSSSSSESSETEMDATNRVRRHTKPKVVAISKLIVKRRSDENVDASVSSSSSESAYINDEMPELSEPAYAALYMNPESHADKKENPMNAQKLTQEIAQQLQNPNTMAKNDVLTKFNILVRIISSMSYDQLALSSRGIEAGKSSTNNVKSDMWMIYRDAVTQAGTLPAFQQIKTWIQNKKLLGEEAAQVVASLPRTLRYPTKVAMVEFFNLALSKEVSEQMYLNSSALIASTRIINMGQVNNATALTYYPTQLYGRFTKKHDRFVVNDILPRLGKLLDEAVARGESHKAQVYIKAIGQLGHRAVLDIFAPYLEGKVPVSTYLRVQIIESLQTLVYERDDYVRVVLYTILRNTAEPYEARVAAIHKIFRSRPTAAMMKAMALMTHDDPSIQVRAVLKSSIENAAELKNPYYYELTKIAQAARHMLTKEDLSATYSGKYFTDSYESEAGLEDLYTFSSIGSEDSLLPKHWRMALKNNVEGSEDSISAHFSSVRHFMDIIKESWFIQQQHTKAASGLKYSADKVAELLGIKRNPEVPLEAAFSINLLNQRRHFAFDENDMHKLPKIIEESLANLAKGVDKHYTKIFNQEQISIMFPLATGMPFIFKYKEPVLVHLQAKAKAQVNLKEKFLLEAEKEFHLTYARNIDGSIGFFDTLTNSYASTGVVSKFQFTIPIKAQTSFKSGEMKLRIEPSNPEQDVTIAHYSVWPYTAYQKKDTLTPVSLDPTTKLMVRDNKVIDTDLKMGESIGAAFQLKGYSYSSDFKYIWNMLRGRNVLEHIAALLRQKDLALTHFNFRYLGSQSQNKALTLTAVYKNGMYFENIESQPLVPTITKDTTPNSPTRREEMVKRVLVGPGKSGKWASRGQVIDFSATFEGPQKTEYLLTAAIGDSLVNQQIQYIFFAGRNSAKLGDYQVNGVGSVRKPETSSSNYLEALKKELKETFEAHIRFGLDMKGDVRIQGSAERSEKCAEELKKSDLAKYASKQIEQNNYYQTAGYYATMMANAPDFFKVSVTYSNLNQEIRNMFYQAFRMAQHYTFWETEMNPLKVSANGKVDIEAQAHFWQNWASVAVTSSFGDLKIKKVPIPTFSAALVSVYAPFKTIDRVLNQYTRMQYLPYCAIDGSKIKTFSRRDYNYTLTKSWHVVMLDRDQKYHQQHDQRWNEDNLVILARKLNAAEVEMYISYRSRDGLDAEINVSRKPGSQEFIVVDKTNAKKMDAGNMQIIWDEISRRPLVEYYTLPNGNMVVQIQEHGLRVLFDGLRMVLLADQSRNNTRGICGRMSGEPRDDYLTHYGIVDAPQHFAALYILESGEDPEIQRLQAEAKKMAYQPRQKYTSIARTSFGWRYYQSSSSSSSSSSSEERDWTRDNVYRTTSYLKQAGACQLQHQVQFYETHGEICISKSTLPACQSRCRGEGFKVERMEVVCRPKLDQQFLSFRDEIRLGQSPKVTGATRMKHFRVPSVCKA